MPHMSALPKCLTHFCVSHTKKVEKRSGDSREMCLDMEEYLNLSGKKKKEKNEM